MNNDEPATIGFEKSRLLEEIYHWHPGEEDVWGCIQDPLIASDMRDLFIEEFAPSLAPEQRLMTKFRDAVEQLLTNLMNPDASNWADTIQVVRFGREDSANLRANSVLSLAHHMQWIVHTFLSVPGASVAIR